MPIAIVGAGLAGLGLCHYLSQLRHDIVVFDPHGIGGGASGLPSGILHPYPGRSGEPSKFAYEAMECSTSLIDLAQSYSDEKIALKTGVIRFGWIPRENYPDMKMTDEGMLIQSGITVYMGAYLKGLASSMGAGVVFEKRRFMPEDVKDYSTIVYAMGRETTSLGFNLPVDIIKGQALIMEHPSRSWDRSLLGMGGHLSPLPDGKVQIGSTYEHHPVDFLPDIDFARNYLRSKVISFLPPLDEFTLCRAVVGARVAPKGTYLPIITQVSTKEWVFTGLGSRGLLYHAYCGRHLANLLC